MDLRDRAMLEVLYGTGVRISELVGLSLADVDLDGVLLRAFGKGAKERIVPLGRPARRSLADWFDRRPSARSNPNGGHGAGDAEAVFLNTRGGRLSRAGAWLAVKKHGDRVGLGDRLSPHVLRHSCATHLLDHGADIRAVQELLGHASISTTQVYTKVTTERLWQVYDQRSSAGEQDCHSPLTCYPWPARPPSHRCAPNWRRSARSLQHQLEELQRVGRQVPVVRRELRRLRSGGGRAGREPAPGRLPQRPARKTSSGPCGKFDDGTYGKCETCGEEIAEARLEAMPATRYCINHA